MGCHFCGSVSLDRTLYCSQSLFKTLFCWFDDVSVHGKILWEVSMSWMMSQGSEVTSSHQLARNLEPQSYILCNAIFLFFICLNCIEKNHSVWKVHISFVMLKNTLYYFYGNRKMDPQKISTLNPWTCECYQYLFLNGFLKTIKLVSEM